MAANDYYSSYPGGDNPASRPPPPHHTTSTQSMQSISPVTSPFDDANRYDNHNPNYSSTAHLTHTQTGASSAYSDTAYHGNDQSHPYNNRYDSPPAATQHDPFTDQNAIPLQQGKMGTYPAAAGTYQMDPEGRPREKRRKKKKKGFFRLNNTWVVYFLTTVQIGVFVGELIKNGVLTGSPIQTKPFNIMIGPSTYVLINMGARYQPCMHYVKSVLTSDINAWPCPNVTSTDVNGTATIIPTCSLSELCGMGGVPDQPAKIDDWDKRGEVKDQEPDQWWRFITPIFLHAGLIHIGFNMLLQLTLGRDMEKEIGPLRFTLVYFASGIFGFVLGGNYAADGISSVGASGSLFGILALVMLDLLYNWKTRRSPVKDLLFILLDIAISFVLGLLPGLDNFSHIGGFLMGLIMGICILHSPQALRERIGVDDPPYAPANQNHNSAPGLQTFVKQPVGFFKGRKPFWWAWWLVRAALLVVVFVGFILLLRNFYEWRNECSWCHHLTCINVTVSGSNWCDAGSIHPTTVPNTTAHAARAVAATATPMPVRLMF